MTEVHIMKPDYDNKSIKADYTVVDTIPAADAATLQNRFFNAVFGWMFAGLFLTGIAAWTVASSASLSQQILGNPGIFYGCIIAELVLVLAVSWGINKISAGVATGLFLLYSVINGLTFSIFFVVYEMGSIAVCFLITASMFGALALYGFLTKRNLATIGTLCGMGLFGLIIALIVNIFVQSSQFDFVISILGVLIFTGLTMWDVQKLRYISEGLEDDGEGNLTQGAKKTAILGALTLYLDFINILIFLIRLFGRRR